jgi:hypothetical protein
MLMLSAAAPMLPSEGKLSRAPARQMSPCTTNVQYRHTNTVYICTFGCYPGTPPRQIRHVFGVCIRSGRGVWNCSLARSLAHIAALGLPAALDFARRLQMYSITIQTQCMYCIFGGVQSTQTCQAVRKIHSVYIYVGGIIPR